jgi:CRP/FNR family cyclic AMP-dependent transcriptional regulator
MAVTVAPIHAGHGPPGSAQGPARGRVVALVDLDPDLGAALEPHRRAAARAELVVRVSVLRVGEWAGGDLALADPALVGLLLVDGVMAREVLLEDTVSTELLGPGDLVRPWGSEGEAHLLRHRTRWQVLAEAHLAVLGRGFGAALMRFPEVNAVLLDRVCGRSQRLATMQAISHLNSVDRRLMALFWHLAERWGRVTRGGVLVPLTLSHRLLGQMVGARRPTVSTALASLERRGELVRRDDGSWLLRGEPPGAPTRSDRLIPPRRRLLAHELAGAPPASPAAARLDSHDREA